MKYICILVINIFFVVACDSDGISGGVTDIDISDENCEGDRPSNVDGYFNSALSPVLLQTLPDTNPNFVNFEPISDTVEFDDFRIGISATYNLTSSSFTIAPVNYDHQIDARQASCAPPSRTSVGPNLTTVDVTATQAINDDLPAGSSLNGIISIAVADSAGDANFPPTMAFVPLFLSQIEYFTLEEFLDTNPIAPIAFFLRLDTQPQSEIPFSISLTYTLSNGLSGTVSTDEFSLM